MSASSLPLIWLSNAGKCYKYSWWKLRVEDQNVVGKLCAVYIECRSDICKDNSDTYARIYFEFKILDSKQRFTYAILNDFIKIQRLYLSCCHVSVVQHLQL